ncbi:hypothetical protein FRB90_007325 [Tulasnella sp. 427]|nr:hypothetical protein FRB90_007325 [Tulasnella sp. 427]
MSSKYRAYTDMSTYAHFPDRYDDHNGKKKKHRQTLKAGPWGAYTFFWAYNVLLLAPCQLMHALTFHLVDEHDDYCFRICGAPQSETVNLGEVRAVVGTAAWNYMVHHYFTEGSIILVADFYQRFRHNRGAFAAALKPQGMAWRIGTYLWDLLNAGEINGPGKGDGNDPGEEYIGPVDDIGSIRNTEERPEWDPDENGCTREGSRDTMQ